ncbi:iron chelate uptake ABC transporter family permease subunit [Actinopolymorpha sp. B11F2]|uniref:iron chelate uptake ABC transporter family permease subunit n=1 Tax=Actinopolymorpha sp. B11F2 TaxID=3160862 RepID=UPI0032E4A4B1
MAAVVQEMVRNALADPFILGVSSDASVGASAVVGFGLFAALGIHALSAAAFLGGVLNDVTIIQVSAVWELSELSPTMPTRRLFTGAMRIGHDHIASTVYTIAFAYAGAALPFLLLISLDDRPFLASLTGGELAEEVVRTPAPRRGVLVPTRRPVVPHVRCAVMRSI